MKRGHVWVIGLSFCALTSLLQAGFVQKKAMIVNYTQAQRYSTFFPGEGQALTAVQIWQILQKTWLAYFGNMPTPVDSAWGSGEGVEIMIIDPLQSWRVVSQKKKVSFLEENGNRRSKHW